MLLQPVAPAAHSTPGAGLADSATVDLLLAMGSATDRHQRLMTPTTARSGRETLGANAAMVTFFCPGCWAESNEESETCPRCGVNIKRLLASKGYPERLADALRHPEPATPLRAAYILGLRREAAVVPALAARAHETSDLFLCLECLSALARIDTPDAWRAVALFSSDARTVVEARARSLLRRKFGADAGY
jgi:hypothetical protein